MEETQENIKIKIAISLNALANYTKENLQNNTSGKKPHISYSEIADSCNMRKATVSDIFNANKTANSFTLFSIIKAMGYELIDFAKVYDRITNRDIINFKTKKDA